MYALKKWNKISQICQDRNQTASIPSEKVIVIAVTVDHIISRRLNNIQIVCVVFTYYNMAWIQIEFKQNC